MNKPLASLSLDLDNKWSYMKTHGDDGWDTFPSYFDIVVPRVLEILKHEELLITFFIVGQDAALEKNHASLRSIADAGHEIGNHSFNHEPWLHLYSRDEIVRELDKAAEAIEGATGLETKGFRGPGFSVSDTVLEVLNSLGYDYDCSTFPTSLGPLARAYYFMTTKLTPEEKEQRKKLFGGFGEALRPNKPYWWNLGADRLIEVPVTTMPWFKIPIHASYVIYLANFSPALAMVYFRVALVMCKIANVQPSILLHPLDFMGDGDAPELDFFPAMRMPLDKKLKLITQIIAILKANFNVVTIAEHASYVREQPNLNMIEPVFESSGN